jgi:hypothetical protein
MIRPMSTIKTCISEILIILLYGNQTFHYSITSYQCYIFNHHENQFKKSNNTVIPHLRDK